MKRREFLGLAGAASAAALIGLPGGAAESTALPLRSLGRTDIRTTILGFGTATGGMGLPDDKAVALYDKAIEMGVNWIDTAPAYARAQAQLAEVLQKRRADVYVATKVAVHSYDGALRQLEQNLKTMRIDQVDLVYIHSLGDYDVEPLLAERGGFAALREAQRRGWTRYIGFTAHSRPDRCAQALQSADVDVIMVAMNYADRHTYGFEKSVLPLAREKGVGVFAMKVYGGARGMDYSKPTASALSVEGMTEPQLALRYALGLEGVAAAVVGMYTEQELEQNVCWAREFQPLTDAEAQALNAEGMQLAHALGPHYGPVSG